MMVQLDPQVNFDWGKTAITELAGDLVAVRWTGYIKAPMLGESIGGQLSTNSDEYYIYVDVDDTVKVWFSGAVVIDHWDDDTCCNEYWFKARMNAGEYYSIRIDYLERQGDAHIQMYWTLGISLKVIIDAKFLYRGAALVGTPYNVTVRPGLPAASTSGMVNPLTHVNSGVLNRIWLVAKDTVGNTVNDTNIVFQAIFVGPNTNMVFESSPLTPTTKMGPQGSPIPVHDHMHYIDYTLAYPGDYTIRLRFADGTELYQSPMRFSVKNSLLQPQMCAVSGPGTLAFTAGVETWFLLHMKDAYFNDVDASSSATIEAGIEWKEFTVPVKYWDFEAGNVLTFNDYNFVSQTVGRFAHVSGIEKINGSHLNITYIGFRQGINHLEVKVDAMLIRGRLENITVNPPPQGQNTIIEVMGHPSAVPDGNKSVLLRSYPPEECTTGVPCSLELQVRDSWGNIITESRADAIRFLLVSLTCNTTYPFDKTDPNCVPIDEGSCKYKDNATHECTLTPTKDGTFFMRTMIHGVDVSSSTGAITGMVYDVLSLLRGPFKIFVGVGEIDNMNSPMEGPGLNVRGNVVGYPQNITVTLRDHWSNLRPGSQPEAVPPATGLIATLGDTVLETINNMNGTLVIVANTAVAGMWRLNVVFGYGCNFNPLRVPCTPLLGSPTPLLRWEPAQISAMGTYCLVMTQVYPGTTDHFTCEGRDEFENRKDDSTVYFRVEMLLVKSNQDVRIYNQTPYVFNGSYSFEDNLWHFYPMLTKAGIYSTRIELINRNQLLARYHKNIGFNSFIANGAVGGLTEPGHVFGFPWEYTRIDYIGLGNLTMDRLQLWHDFGMWDYWSVIWYGEFEPTVTGNQTIVVKSGGAMRIELDGVVIHDNLPGNNGTIHLNSLGNNGVIHGTDFRYPIYLSAMLRIPITIWYAHGTGPAYIQFGLIKEEGPDRHLLKLTDDSQWLSTRILRKVRTPETTFNQPLYTYVFPLDGDKPSYIVERIGGGNFTTARVAEDNRFFFQTADQYGNDRIYGSTKPVAGYIFGPPRVEIVWQNLQNGQYIGIVGPRRAPMDTWMVITVGDEQITGSPFPLQIQTGMTSVTKSLMEGIPDSITAGVVKCWNITLRDIQQNKRLTAERVNEPGVEEDGVGCHDPGVTCTHMSLGVFKCCWNKTYITPYTDKGNLPFTCHIRGESINSNPFAVTVHAHPVGANWPTPADWNTTVLSMKGPYEFPVVDQYFKGWKDWPSTYYRRIQNEPAWDPPQQWNRLKLEYKDGFGNTVLHDTNVILLCEVWGPHGLSNRAGTPLYVLPVDLDTNTGEWYVYNSIRTTGTHKIYCFVQTRGGLNVQYFGNAAWEGVPLLQSIDAQVNLGSPLEVPILRESLNHVSARWNGALCPRVKANYTVRFVAVATEATFRIGPEYEESWAKYFSISGSGVHEFGPLELGNSTIYGMQVAWRANSKNSSVHLYWRSDGGSPFEIIPADVFCFSKSLLKGYPVTMQVQDVPGPMEQFFRVNTGKVGEVTLNWTDPLELNGRPIESYRLRHDNGLGGAFNWNVTVPETRWTTTYIIPLSYKSITVTGLSPAKIYRFELRATNDDRWNSQVLLNGGGLSQSPVILSLQPTASNAALAPLLLNATRHKNGTASILLQISPPAQSNQGLLFRYRLYKAVEMWVYHEDSVPITRISPPMTVIEDEMTFDAPVNIAINNLIQNRTYNFTVAYVFAFGETNLSEPQRIICCEFGSPGPSLNVRRLVDYSGDRTAAALQTDDRITIAWDPPASAGHRPIQFYRVSLTPVKVTQANTVLRATENLQYSNGPDDRTMQFTGLAAGQSYGARVAAVSQAGVGPWSVEFISVATGFSTDPRNVTAITQSHTELVIGWKQPLRIGAGDLKSYRILCNASPTSNELVLIGESPAAQTFFLWRGVGGTKIIPTLIVGRWYRMVIQAVNEAGVGALSVSYPYHIVAAGKPSAPLSFGADLEMLSIGVSRLSWTAPASDGYSPILSYRAERKKIVPGVYLTQCSRRTPYDNYNCSIGNWEYNKLAPRNIIAYDDYAQVLQGKVMLFPIQRTTGTQSVYCSKTQFGDPLYPTHSDPARSDFVQRECWMMVEKCVDNPTYWHDFDGTEFNCAWYGAEPSRCTVFGVEPASAGVWGQTAAEACCVCNGGKKTVQMKHCATEGEYCILNSTVPSSGTEPGYTDGVTNIYYGKLTSSIHKVSDNDGRVSCVMILTLPPLSWLRWDEAHQFCYILEYNDGEWHDIMPVNWTNPSLTYDDVTIVQDNRYEYKAFAVNGATGGTNQYSSVINVALGGLPEPPIVTALSTDEYVIRIGWDRPTNPALKVDGYRVYVNGELKYDGADNPDILEYTEENCIKGAIYDLKVTAVNQFGEVLDPNMLTRFCARRPFAPEKPTVVSTYCSRTRMIGDYNSITITYNEPADNGGRSIKGWWIQRTKGNSMAFRNIGPLFPLGETVVQFEDNNDLDGWGPVGLDWGEIYKYRVVATNEQDDYNYDSASDFITVMCADATTLAPAKLERLPATVRNAIAVTWSEVIVNITTDRNAAPVSGYLVYGGNGTDGEMELIYNGTGKPMTRTYVHGPLVPGDIYRFEVAVSVDTPRTIDYEPRSPVGMYLAAVLPTAPVSPFLISAQPTTLKFGWLPPADNGGSPITGYIVKHDGGDKSKTELDVSITISSMMVQDLEITGLLAGQPVRVEVIAVNSLGQGPGIRATFRALTAIPSIPLGQKVLSLAAPLGSQQQAAAASLGTLSCQVYVGVGGKGELTRVTGLSQDVLCGMSSNEPIASLIAGSFLPETAFSFVGMDDRRDGSVIQPFRIVEPPRTPQKVTVSSSAEPATVSLSWEQLPDFEASRSIVIERDTAVDDPYWEFLTSLPAHALTFNDTSVKLGETYRYRFFYSNEAERSQARSEWSNEVHVPEVGSVPYGWHPFDHSLERWNYTSDTFTLGWPVMKYYGSRTTTFDIYRSTTQGGAFRLVYRGQGPAHSAVLPTLNPEFRDFFYVTAKNEVGQSLISPFVWHGNFEPPPPPRPILNWAFCYTRGRINACEEWLGIPGAKGCVSLHWLPPDYRSITCPIQGYRVLRDGIVQSVGETSRNVLRIDEAHFVDVWDNNTDPLDCFDHTVNVGNPEQVKMKYTIQTKNCMGWGPQSEPLLVPVIAPPAKVCGQWEILGEDTEEYYSCKLPGLTVDAINATALRFYWTLLQDASLETGAVPLNRDISMGAQMVGSLDMNMLLGYELLIDDGRGGPFEVIYDGMDMLNKNTTDVYELLPAREYRAFVRAIGYTGRGDASNMVYVVMDNPPPAPTIYSITYVGRKAVQVWWSMPVGAEVPLPFTHFVLERAEESPAGSGLYPAWLAAPASPAGNTEYNLAVTNVEPNTLYSFRVRAVSNNGYSAPSPDVIEWVGELPTQPVREVRRVESPESEIYITWEPAVGELLGIERLEYDTEK
jgi:hypothetical protein